MSETESQDLVVATLLVAEYTALREEIGRYQDHQRQLFNTVFLLIGGAVTLATQASRVTGTVVTPRVLLLCIPPMFTLLTLLYLDRAVRIVRLAHYLHHHARPTASRVANGSIWEWEKYKNETRVVSRRLALMLDRLRWSVFIVPLVGVSVMTTFAGADASIGYRVVSVVVGLVSFGLALGAALLTEETTGVVYAAPQSEVSNAVP